MSYILDALQRADAERARGSVPGLHTPQLADATSQARRATGHRLWIGMAALMALGLVAATLWLRPTPASEPRPLQASPAPPPSPAPAPMAQALLAAVPVALAPAARPVTPAKPVATAPAVTVPTPLPASSPAAPMLAELGEDLRRQIPVLSITGAVHSQVPGQRMLLLNGLVLKQGDAVAPELILEEIGAAASVFSFRGARFRVAH